MPSNRAMYYALLSLALCCLGSALRQGGQARGDTAPSMRDVREVAKAAEAAGHLWAHPPKFLQYICTSGNIYLNAAKGSPSDGAARHMVLMENVQTQGHLAEEQLAEQDFLSGADLGPGGGPGIRYQSPGLPCASCWDLRLLIVFRCAISSHAFCVTSL